MTQRMLPPSSGPFQTMQANGRTYTAAPGSSLDVNDADAAILNANGWTSLGQSGPTSARPTIGPGMGVYTASPGARFIDTTLNKNLIYDGASWRDHNGSAW